MKIQFLFAAANRSLKYFNKKRHEEGEISPSWQAMIGDFNVSPVKLCASPEWGNIHSSMPLSSFLISLLISYTLFSKQVRFSRVGKKITLYKITVLASQLNESEVKGILSIPLRSKGLRIVSKPPIGNDLVLHVTRIRCRTVKEKKSKDTIKNEFYSLYGSQYVQPFGPFLG